MLAILEALYDALPMVVVMKLDDIVPIVIRAFDQVYDVLTIAGHVGRSLFLALKQIHGLLHPLLGLTTTNVLLAIIAAILIVVCVKITAFVCWTIGLPLRVVMLLVAAILQILRVSFLL